MDTNKISCSLNVHKFYTIRPIRDEEIYLLKDFLYEAIFVPKGMEAPPRNIIEIPELIIYIKDFGKKKDDYCLVVECNNKTVGAVWTRIMNDYGHVDDYTPSLSISLYPEYRHKGIGTKLMEEMVKLLSEKRYRKVSLSVQKTNYAVYMYKKLGFVTIKETEEEYIMVKQLNK